MTLDVSVVIPTHNRATVLPRALDSVYAQTHPPGEVIVVDDGSDDGTAELIRECYPCIRYLHQRNLGVSHARNRGIAGARFRWIALLDSDDAWLPGKLAAQRAALESAPGLRICHTEEIWIRRGRRVNPMRKHAKYGGRIFRHCLQRCVISPSSVIIHHSVFDEVGLFDTSLPACEDYDLWLRACARFPVCFVREPQIMKYGGHSDQLSRRFPAMDRFRIYALEKLLDSEQLGQDDRSAAVAMLSEKAGIYAAGAERRGRAREAATYRAKMVEHAQG
jgi:glycosyltransferase involved in cell wall biosynthesis